MTGPKTNERPGTRAVLRHSRVAPNKVREVLDLIRNRPVQEAEAILRFSERDAATVVGKVLHSAIANAENNEDQEAEELYVSACFADEGTTVKRWRPRARGRATRIRKRTSHITVIVSRLPADQLERLRARRRAEQLAARERRVRGSRREAGDTRTRAQRRAGVTIEELEGQEAGEVEEIEVSPEAVDTEPTPAEPEPTPAEPEPTPAEPEPTPAGAGSRVGGSWAAPEDDEPSAGAEAEAGQAPPSDAETAAPEEEQ
jgi:large subunit ribosomal protein L22